MKVLWFANTPCGAVEKLNNNINGGGWLPSLEKELIKRDDIKLTVCFYYTKKNKAFFYNGVNYYPIYREYSDSKLLRYFSRLLRRQNNDQGEKKKLLSVIESTKPDVIHIHGTEDNFGLIQYHTNIPIVISIQGILSPYSEKYYSGIPQKNATKHEGIFVKIRLNSKKYLYSNFLENASRERKILRTVKYVIGRTGWDCRVTRVLSPGSKYFVNNEIIRTSFYDNIWEKKEFDKKLRIITTLGEALYKGFEDIVKTANVLSGYPGLNFEWVVAGLSNSSSTVKIVKNWLKADFEKINIKLLGPKNEKELIQTLLSADIYCQVSHIENSPNSLCEAMLLGMPVITTFAGGTSSLIEDGKEGLIIQDGDQYSLAGSIIELYNDFNKAKQYGEAARKRALLRHDKKVITEGLVNIYKSILTNSNPYIR